MWRDEYFTNLDPSEKLLFMYALTSPDTNIAGVYEIPLKIMATDTGLDRDTVERILGRFERDGKIKYENGWMAIKNFRKHQLDNPKVKRGIELGLKDAPELLCKWLNGKTIYSLSHLNSNSNSNPNLNINSNIKESSAPSAEQSCDVYNKLGKRRGHLPDYCRTRNTRGWCIQDKTECMKLFNIIRGELKKAGLSEDHKQYHGAFTNRISHHLNNRAEQISASVKEVSK